MRVIHSPVNVAGGPGAISQGLHDLGVESTLVVFNERPFERGFDRNLRLRDPTRRSSMLVNVPKQLAALAWALPRFDVFHFHAGATLAPARLNLRPAHSIRRGGLPTLTATKSRRQPPLRESA